MVQELLGRCKGILSSALDLRSIFFRTRYQLLEALGDKCKPFWDICHYKRKTAFINIGSMFRQDYAQLSIFAGLDGNQIGQLSHFIDECQFPKDYVIFEQGQPADHLYILLAGEVEIRYKPYDGPPLLVARIEPGGVFGWSAALRRDVYTSGAVSIRDSAACTIRGANLHLMRAQYPQTSIIFLERLASVIAERLRSTHTQILGMLTQGLNMDENCSERSTSNDRE